MALKCLLVALDAFAATVLDGTALGRPLELAAGCGKLCALSLAFPQLRNRSQFVPCAYLGGSPGLG